MKTSDSKSITTKTTILALLVVTVTLAHSTFAGDFVVTDRPAKSGFVVTDRPKKSQDKPVMYFYTANWCGPCKVPSGELSKEAESLPFKIVKVDVDKTPLSPLLPESEQTIPHFEWNGADGARLYCKWKDREDLVSRWSLSQERAKKKPSSGSSGARWTWPGRLDDHLVSSHGVNPLGMSQKEMEDLHDGLHEGRKR